MVTAAQLKKISKSKTQKPALIAGLVTALSVFPPHVQAHQIAQTAHESGGFVFDREVWGPTAAQQKYEGRKDLGNVKKGDGSLYRGYGPIQVTGRKNVTAFYNWCKAQGYNPPDFVASPQKIADAPWAGYSVVWYWEKGNPTGKSLTPLADENNIELITRRVNGGLNGYDDRLSYYDRAALVLLGYGVSELRKFQKDHGLTVDGLTGPRTRTAMHKALVALTPGEAARPEVRAAPVVETVQEAVAVTPASIEQPWYKSNETITTLVSTGAVGSVASVTGIPWQNLAILAVAGLAIVVTLLVLKNKDKKVVQAKVEAINASSAPPVVEV